MSSRSRAANRRTQSPPQPVATSRAPRVRLWRVIVGAAALALTLSGCSAEDDLRFGWPRGITPQAEKMRNLWTWSAVAALVVGVLVWGLIFWCVIRYRKRKNDDEELPAQTSLNLPIETLYTILPILIVLVLFYYTALAQGFVDKETKHPDVTVNVVAFKWNWDFQYPGVKDKDGQPVETFGTTEEVPILVLPTDKTIRFNEHSQDVIHSFWVPDLLFKRDVIPGRHNSFEVTITRPGAYVGRCAELCGTYHSAMNFELRAVKPVDYQKFLTAKKDGKSTADALRAIGQAPYSTTTKPFTNKRTTRTAS